MDVIRREIRDGIAMDGTGYDYRHHGYYEFGFQLNIRSSEVDQAYSWCLEQFGLGPSGGRWYMNRYVMYFSNAADAIAFKLRWM